MQTGKRRLLLLAVGWIGLVSAGSEGCTSFSIAHAPERVFAKSYDWHHGHGQAVVNLRGVGKKAIGLAANDTPVRWESRNASLTFNQHGREFPLGGVNEKGLAIEILWLAGSGFPASDARPAINELQWIQYNLDSYDNVKKMHADADSIRISPAYADVHYLACDAQGDCATFEYLDGKLTSALIPPSGVGALANTPYQDSLSYLSNFVGFGGALPLPSGDGSNQRFVRAAGLAKQWSPTAATGAVETAFGILDSVGGTSYSKFHIVYETKSSTVHWRTLSARATKTVRLSDFKSLQCSQREDLSRVLDLNEGVAGEVVASFQPYSAVENRAMVDAALEGIEDTLPPGIAGEIAAYPEQLPCL